MIPMLIGNSGRPLHAVFTAASGKRRRRAAVFCPPFGLEYQRSHRTARLLAQRLAAAGCDVLRFDYYGTGDSAGEDHEFDPDGAVDDALSAIEEAQDLGKARKVTLVGLRDGAGVALRAAAAAPAVDRLVLWDPVDDAFEGEAPIAPSLILVREREPVHERLRLRLAPHATLEEQRGPAAWVPANEDGIGIAPVAAMDRIVGWEP
jgi:pimeloyl-ACP methyl ester carboxylesterase